MLAIDLDKCFGCLKCRSVEPGLYELIERGVRAVVCRHCQNPPCVNACPVEALEKLRDGGMKRKRMKCVSCKQCSTACPVGANPVEVLSYKTFPGWKVDIKRCRRICRREAVKEVEKTPQGYELIDGEYAVKAGGWK